MTTWHVGEHILITHPHLAAQTLSGHGRLAVILGIRQLAHGPDDGWVLLTKGTTSPTATEVEFHERWCKKVEDELDYQNAVSRWILRFEGLKP